MSGEDCGGGSATAAGAAGTVITRDGVVAWLRTFAAAVTRERDQLTALDAAIGDADHGINMDRGMQAVVGKLDEPVESAAGGIGALLKTVGMTLVSTVGGAAGPLYGTLFLQMGAATDQASSPPWRNGPRRSRPECRGARLQARRSSGTRR